MQSAVTAQDVINRCQALGFARAGIAPAAPTAYADELRDWLAAGKHGEMHYLEKYMDQRLDPRNMLPGAAAVICVADRYDNGWTDDPNASNRPVGRIARYARGRDYHKVMKKRLHQLCDELNTHYPDHEFRACVDTAPVLEREHAQRAGLGAVGKHTLLIEHGVGSYLLLGEILTTLAIEPTQPAEPDPCGSCTRCIDACPTDAITPWSVDATKCISYLTIEHRSAIDQQYHEAIGDWIFGCDICQEVCPHNQPTQRAQAAPIHDAYEHNLSDLNLLEVLDWSDADRRHAFAGSAMKRAKLNMIKRNALIVAGNYLSDHDDRALRERIEDIAKDAAEDDIVRCTATTVLSRLNGSC